MDQALKLTHHYTKAPVTEALIDLHVRLPGGTPLSAIKEVASIVKAEYPEQKDRVYVEGQFSAGPEVGASAKQTLMGYALYSTDKLQVFQARLDGFTFSRLRPYVDWQTLRDEAKRLSDIYWSVLRPEAVTRVAVRYINQIDIPLPMDDFKTYLRTVPEVSPELPQALSGFFMRLHFPQSDFNGQVVLTQMMIPPPRPDLATIMLDIDVFADDTTITSDEQVWELLERLRDRKNEFFEGCITDRARDLFNQESN